MDAFIASDAWMQTGGAGILLGIWGFFWFHAGVFYRGSRVYRWEHPHTAESETRGRVLHVLQDLESRVRAGQTWPTAVKVERDKDFGVYGVTADPIHLGSLDKPDWVLRFGLPERGNQVYVWRRGVHLDLDRAVTSLVAALNRTVSEEAKSAEAMLVVLEASLRATLSSS